MSTPESLRDRFVDESDGPLTSEQEALLALVVDLCDEGWINYVEPDTDPDGRERLYSFGNLRRTVREALGLD